MLSVFNYEYCCQNTILPVLWPKFGLKNRIVDAPPPDGRVFFFFFFLQNGSGSQTPLSKL